MGRHLTAALAFLTAVLWAQPVWSQGAEDLLKEAELNFKMARFQRSLKLLRRAEQRATDPWILGKVLLCRGLNDAVLGRRSRARRSFHAALTHDPTLDLAKERYKPSVVELFQQVRQKMRGQLEVSADQESAVVHIDTEPAGGAPTTIDLPIGKHKLKVITTDGRWLYEGEVVVHLGGLTKVEAKLDRVASAPRLVDLQPVGDGSPVPEPVASQESARSLQRALRITSWTLIGVGAVGLVAGTVLAGLVSAKNTEYQEAVDEGRPWEELQQISDSAKQLETGQYIAFGAGGAVAAVGLGLLVWSLLSESPEDSAAQKELSWSIQPLVNPGGSGLTGLCRF